MFSLCKCKFDFLINISTQKPLFFFIENTLVWSNLSFFFINSVITSVTFFIHTDIKKLIDMDKTIIIACAFKNWYVRIYV